MRAFLFAAVATATKTRLRDFDPSGYEADWYQPNAPVQSGEVYYAAEDPYVEYHDERHHHGHGREYADHAPVVVYDHDHADHHADGEDYHDHDHHEHHAHEHHDYEQYYYDAEYVEGKVPTGNFWDHVDDFNVWEEIWDQNEYEERVQTEAEMMIALEATREALVDLDYDIDRLEDLIEENHRDIQRNLSDIRNNDDHIEENDDEIEDQQRRVKYLQRQCRYCEDRLSEDRDALVLYCQQFAWSNDMVGACADILTCSGTELRYRWTNWTQAPVVVVKQY